MMIESEIGEQIIATNLKQFLLVLSVSLSVATLPQIFSWFRQIPYTLLLVIVGLGLAIADVRLVTLSPGLILFIFLPPLLFEAAWNLHWKELKEDFFPICLYAVFGVVISILGVAIGLNQLAGLSLTTALLIGASLSATDPVSVTALFRELGVGKRLVTLMEGESLFNDGMAVVAFGFLVALPLGKVQLGLQPILIELLTVVGIGVAVGSLIGFGISYLTQRFDLPMVEQSLTLVSAYGTYLIIEDLGGSGVIGVVTTGLILGNFGSRIGMNPRTRIIVSEFWEFLAFFVNSIVFLLIGDQIRFASLGENLGIIFVTVIAMIVMRALAIYILSFVSTNITKSEISLPEQTILWWGGLRGSVSIALALSVPTILPERDKIIATVFGVVLFTLLVQGLTIKPLLEKLNLLGDAGLREQYLELSARNVALERVLQHLQADQRLGIDHEFYRYQEALIKGEIHDLQRQIDQLQNEYPHLKEFSTEQFRGELLAIEADTYAEFVRSGRLNKELAPMLQNLLQSGNQKEV
ncbi:sodium:proton antiporter [Anabaena cylindrica FACHB-243]|uniref:Sodium/proton antiporter, CPA1 family n=1 Tax=Anabaena cylindrica (strain ATCC 27899 / PCC 7122) TaxID=272123 RepID=K9ZBN9_ANACC|nr:MULTISPECIES: sodium:proton antiporter [Anabaena]AFZ56618.1 sodium/proton antiporter, CPA1 family [Anabaena cylindrica PCC 7122]MBD2416210.1 sodium:proton antiporter [Anabaena cylindrica FACHB-243]MBY5284802.1 sodium:proton antiporter [Anabaena sp. CCAP 1446/1C]MBY5310968.1 sodium:proton antiporter [Anabaena sp. CCAP 1446/1C]MCM2408911.1 sodium:proton antiporter [Anabaena sp. CCAP 1446/1C]